MVRTLRLQDSARPEPARIAAIAAAIAVHLLAFLLLLLPLAGPADEVTTSVPMQLRWELPEPVVIPPLPPRQVEPPTVRPPRATLPTHIVQPPVLPPSVVEQEIRPSNFGEAAAAEPAPAAAAIEAGPVAGAQLRYAHAPAPSYPRAEARAGIEGTVLLKVLVDTDGKPLEVSLEQSSGNRSLDMQARNQVLKHWRFEPAMRAGRPVQAYGLVPIHFSLQ